MEILFNFKMKYIEERSSVINPIEDYKLLLKSKKKLRVKLGVDPTAPDVTLGWYSVIRALKKFQEYGHDVILILGEFTAKVGDPSGKSETRNILDDDSINENSDGVLPIIKSILHQDNLEIVSNKDWLSKLSINDMMSLASSTTLAQMLEREDFSNRYENKNPISLLEFFYPLFQGYDSVAVKSDIEIGGNDQLWNLMLGRDIQKYYGLNPQVAITFPLLIGTDGKKKMSQSYDNYISISDTPENIFGKIMSIPDETMWDYFLMLTDLELDVINEYKSNVKNDKENPFKLKKILGDIDGIDVVGDRFVFSSEVLFDRGSADIGLEGKLQLDTISNVLKDISQKIPEDINWVLRVDGHTDKTPVSQNSIFKDNWELSQARSLSVVTVSYTHLTLPTKRIV